MNVNEIINTNRDINIHTYKNKNASTKINMNITLNLKIKIIININNMRILIKQNTSMNRSTNKNLDCCTYLNYYAYFIVMKYMN